MMKRVDVMIISISFKGASFDIHGVGEWVVLVCLFVVCLGGGGAMPSAVSPRYRRKINQISIIIIMKPYGRKFAVVLYFLRKHYF